MNFCPLCKKRHEQITEFHTSKERPATLLRCTGCQGTHSFKFKDSSPDSRGIERQRVSEEMWRWLQLHWPAIEAQFETPLQLHRTEGWINNSKRAFTGKYSRQFWQRLNAPAGVKEIADLIYSLEQTRPNIAYFIALRAMGFSIRQIAISGVLNLKMLRGNKENHLTRSGQKLIRAVMGHILSALPDELIVSWQAETVRTECIQELSEC